MKTFAACTLALVAGDFASAFTVPVTARSATSVARASSSVSMSVGDEVGLVRRVFVYVHRYGMGPGGGRCLG